MVKDIYISFTNAQENNQSCTIALFPENEKKLADYLAGKNGVVIKKYSMTFSFEVNKKIVEKCLYYLSTKIHIEFNNIMNANTTRTPEGLPFAPQTVEISKDGTISVKDDPNTSIRLVYDPTHPDSIKDGQNKGYVQYPGINKPAEMENLYNTISLYNLFADIYMSMFSGCYVKKENFNSYVNIVSTK